MWNKMTATRRKKRRYLHRCFPRGVLATDGEFWQIQRRFLLRNLRDFGFGKRSMELTIQEEAVILVKHLEALATKHPEGVSLPEVLTLPVINTLWSIVAGERHDLTDETFKEYLNLQDKHIRNLDSGGGIFNVLPWIRHICPEKSGYNTTKNYHHKIWNFFLEMVNQHKDTLQINYSRDLIDVYLHEILSNDSNYTFSEPQLISVLKDLFVAGSETTSNSLSFFFLYMVLYPEIQSKVYEEIERVVGYEKLPSLDDRKEMPYLSAVLLEVQRISSIASQVLPHRALADVEIGGYIIPKDSTVMMLLYSVNMDKEYWGDPEVFRPERHLNEEGVFIPSPRVVPFGLGHRRCLGETLAKSSLFLFSAIFLQSLSLSLPFGKQPPSTRSRSGLTLAPEPYNVVLRRRRR